MWVQVLILAVIGAAFAATEVLRAQARARALAAQRQKDLELRLAAQEETIEHLGRRLRTVEDAVFASRSETGGVVDETEPPVTRLG
jgi:uncharacterized membrane protein